MIDSILIRQNKIPSAIIISQLALIEIDETAHITPVIILYK